MATCLSLNQQILAKCRNASPGLSEIYLANYDSLYPTGGTAGHGFTLNATNSLVIGITGDTEAGYSSGFFYKFIINRENASFKDEAQINIPNGSRIYKPTLTFKITSLSEEVRTVFKELSEATVIAIVKDLEGKYFLIGKDNGLDLSTGSSATTGTAATDFKGVEFTLVGIEDEPFIEIDTAAVSISSLLVTT